MRILGLFGLLLLLAACGDQAGGGPGGLPPRFPAQPPPGVTPPPANPPPGGSGSISGTVALGRSIATGTVRGTYVFALYYVPEYDAIDPERSKWVEVRQEGRQASYAVASLVAGYYLVLGWKDVDGDGDLSSPDYLGVYADPQGNPLVQPGRTGVNLTLELASTGGFALDGAALRRVRVAQAP